MRLKSAIEQTRFEYTGDSGTSSRSNSFFGINSSPFVVVEVF